MNCVCRWGELDKETVQERLNFDLVTRKLLAGLEPVVMAEQVHWISMLLPVVARANKFGGSLSDCHQENILQEFCVAFFKMDSKLGEERPGGRVVAARTKKQVVFQKYKITKTTNDVHFPSGYRRSTGHDVSLVWSPSLRLRG